MTTPQNPFALPNAAPAPTPVPGMPHIDSTAAALAPIPGVAQPAPINDVDPFDAPAPQSDRPRVRDMFGRLMLICPLKVETVKNKLSSDPDAKQDRMTADVIVLDGGVLHYGGAPEKIKPEPHTKTAQTPMKIDRLFISQAGLVSQCRDALAKRQRGERGMVLGRLGVGEATGDQHPPYVLSLPTEDDKAIARRYLATQDPFA